ncbi:MAG: hypothetical protein M1511_11195 [Deltaproteobacteria bacterium]|nr:hypothetical protein [Deltaproteobacteria bacterium]
MDGWTLNRCATRQEFDRFLPIFTSRLVVKDSLFREIKQLDDKDLTAKQRKWLETSKKIGPGPMTRTERETLEKLYADMLPTEQQELMAYIKEKYGKDELSDTDLKDDPIARMEKTIWSEPSAGLKRMFGKVRGSKPPVVK